MAMSMIKEIDEYILTVLKPQLISLGVSDGFSAHIMNTVTMQMESAIFNWQYDNDRAVLMALVTEESHFYKPNAPEDVKAFVVLTLRNSPLETLQANTFKKAGLSNKISNSQLVEITSAAIRYFRNVDLIKLSERINSQINIPQSDTMQDSTSQPENVLTDFPGVSIKRDIYGELREKYFVTWNTLEYISFDGRKHCEFDSYVHKGTLRMLMSFVSKENVQQVGVESVVDGFDSSIDNGLYDYLKEIAEHRSLFFIDCFKMLSRNPEKLFVVLEYLLTNGATVITANYLLEQTLAEKRVPVLKAASGRNATAEMHRHVKNRNGLQPLHADLLSRVGI